MGKTKPAALGKGHVAGCCSENVQNHYITKSEHCPKFIKCSAPICPLDPNWRARTHLRGEPVCFYLREYSKVGPRLKFEGGLTEQTHITLVRAYLGITAAFYDIKKQLKRSAKTGSRLSIRPGRNIKAA